MSLRDLRKTFAASASTLRERGWALGCPESAIKLPSSARAVMAVIDALDSQDVTLVVHDLGGPPRLVGAAPPAERVRSIVAMNAFGWRPIGAFFRGMLVLMGSAPVRELDVLTDFLTRITEAHFGIDRHMDGPSRQAFRAGIDRQARRAYHHYLRDVLDCDSFDREAQRALTGPFKSFPLITIFGERNDLLGFQSIWKALFSDAPQIFVVGRTFPHVRRPRPRGPHHPFLASRQGQTAAIAASRTFQKRSSVHPDHQPIAKSSRTAGNFLIFLSGLALVGSPATKFVHLPEAVGQLGSMGLDGNKLMLVAVIELLSAVLFLARPICVPGLLLVSTFLGGAITTHIQQGQSPAQAGIFLCMVWLGASFRHPEIRTIMNDGGLNTTQLAPANRPQRMAGQI
jgi:pimeloyl-ACP methyl ester carboxylesterase